MIKNPEDKKLVTKEMVQKVLEIISGYTFVTTERGIMVHPKPDTGYLSEKSDGEYLNRQVAIDAIDKLPACPPAVRRAVEIKSPEEIERAIKRLRSWGQGEQGEETVSIYTGRQVAVILEYALDLRLEKTVPGVIRKLFDEEQIFGKAESGKVE